MKVIISFILLIILSSCGKSDARDKVKTDYKKVMVSRVSEEHFIDKVKSFGYVASKKELKLSFKISGIVAKILVKNGDKVKKGQLLASLNLTEINAKVEQSKIALEKAKRDLERIRTLRHEKVATLEQLQNIESAYQNAKANYQIAVYNQKYAQIVAPADGYILGKFAETNELVQAGQPIFQFGKSTEHYVIKAGISDKDILKLNISDLAIVEFDAYPAESFKAEVIELAASANQQSGLFDIELKLNISKKLISGMIGKITIKIKRSEKVLTIPFSSLVEVSNGQAKVFLMNEGRVKSKRIEFGKLFGNKVIVKSGLEKSDLVVYKGNDKLIENDPVEVVSKNNAGGSLQ